MRSTRPTLPNRLRVLLVVPLLLAATSATLTHAAPAAPAAPAVPNGTITVTTTDQEVNSDADCSLQEAIFAANFDAALAINPNSLNGPKITTGCAAGSGADTIVLPANGLFLTNGTVASGVQNGVTQDQFNPAGLTATPTITSTITIQGNGARFERIGVVDNMRAFMVNQQVGVEVSHAQGDLTILNMHIKGFRAQGGTGSDGGGGGMGAGGAIYVRNGTLTIENSTFEGNSATGGTGAAFGSPAGGGGGGGMSTSSIGGNDAVVGAGNGGGGGGGARGRGGNGAAAGGGGGGTALNGVDGGAGVGGNGGFNCGGKGGDFPNNGGAAGFCSGGAAGGGAQGTGAGVNGGNGGAGNYGGAGGGGGASAQAQGGNGGNGGFGGGGGAGGTGTSNGGNGGFGGGGGARGSVGGTPGTGGFFGIGGTGGLNGGGGGSGLGGAIFNDSGNVTVRNSTFFGNSAVSGLRGSTAGNGGTSGVGLGGAIWSRNGTLNIIHATFNQNSVTPAAGTGVSEGAVGMWTDSGGTGTFNLRNSILFGNGSSECSAFQPGGGGAITKTGSGNLIGSNSGGTAACPGVVSTADPVLGPLQINPPGNTPTMAIEDTSPAFNTGDGGQSLPTDQRGVPRPQGAGPDIGAFELIVADLSLTKACYARAAGYTGPPGGGGGGPQPGGDTLDASPNQTDTDVVNAGGQWICTIGIFNGSGTDLTDIAITDTLQAGMTFVAHTVNDDADTRGSPGVCSPLPLVGPGEVTCGGIDVDAFEFVQFQLAFVVDPNFLVRSDTGGNPNGSVSELPITNTACISDIVGLSDPDLSNNCDSDTDLVKDLADLRVSKFVEPFTSVRAGQIFTYTIYVDNVGPSAARRVTITDTLLSSGNVSIQSCAFSVSQGGGAITQFTCTTGNLVSTQFGSDIGTFQTNFLEPLSPTSQGRLRASFRLVANQDIDVTNTVRVSSATPDPDWTNNFSEVFLSVTAVADLQAFSVFGAEVQTNGSPGNIFNSNVITPMPDPACCNFGGTTVTAGRRIQWDTTVLNAGPSRAENVKIEVLLPYGTSIIENTLTGLPPGGSGVPGRCSTEWAGELRKKVICEYGTLQRSQQGSLRFLVLVDPTLPPGTQLSFDSRTFSSNFMVSSPPSRKTVTVLAAPNQIDVPGTFDPNLSNNVTSIQFDTNAWADLAITKSAIGDVVTGYNATLGQFTKSQVANQVTAGELLQYTLVVNHKGPSLARDVRIRDDLPGPAGPIAQVHFVSATTPDGEFLACTVSGVLRDIVDCALGDMMPGQVRTVRILVRVDPSVAAGSLLINSATVSADTADPFLADNTATNTTSVTAVADVWVTKVDVPAAPALDAAFEPDWAVAGNEHRYQITFGNNGPSTAVGVNVTDLLDFKQAGILGETLLRCEPIDPDDQVTCAFSAPNTVTVTRLQVGNEAVIPAAGTGTLVPGKSYGFYLITRVDPGYVLDADNTGSLAPGQTVKGFLALDTANITTTTTDFRTQNNTDRHQTLIVASADLSITKVDDFEGFLQCDPVARGGTVFYDLIVTNNGPSDAAEVFVVDQLPLNGLVLDPAEVEVTFCSNLTPPGCVPSTRGEVVEIRDDGQITLRIGNDPNNAGVLQRGRLNAPLSPGSGAVRIHIEATVAETAPCGAEMVNSARVETRRNDVTWPPAGQPFPGLDGGPRTPTADPNLANNVDSETTTVRCPSIEVNKTVSFDGTCPGTDFKAISQPGLPLTFCFEITNTGDTFLDTIQIVDTLRSRHQTTVIFTDTITGGGDPLLAVAPGETVVRQVTIPNLLTDWECGIVDDTVEVTAVPVNSGRTVLACLPIVEDSDTARVEVPCAGVDFRVQLPILNQGECDAWIQIQNVGDVPTKALVVIWGEAGFCPPQASGPLKIECTGLLRPGSAWSLAPTMLPQGAMSAVAYSMNAIDRVPDERGNELIFADLVCGSLFDFIVGDHDEWLRFDEAYRRQGTYFGPLTPSGDKLVLDFGAHQGEPLAITVNRQCPDPSDPNVVVNAAYTGVSSDEEGAYDPVSGGYTYYAPLVMANAGGLNSWIWVQNSGTECSSLEIWLRAQDNCLRAILADVLALAPGETVHIDPNTVVGPNWQGSAWIRASQPLGVVVDTMGPNHFTAYKGVVGDIYSLQFSHGTQVNYAPLIYNQQQGWDTAIAVQNLSSTTNAKVKVYFLDQSGGILETLVDWICPRGSQIFFLPVIGTLPGNMVGSARIESQEWWSPGDPVVDPPRVQSIVLLERWDDPARTLRREAVAYNGSIECVTLDWQIGHGDGSDGSAVLGLPLLAKENRGITTEIAITNLVAKPGFTDFAIFIYDQNGLIDWVCEKLNEKQVEYIDLARWGWINPRWLGSGVISATFWEHDVFDDDGTFLRNLVGLSSVAVERVGATQGTDVPGDESKAYEAFPLFDFFLNEGRVNCPGVP